MRKKANIGMQFNWIFILIVGVALLGVFFMQYQSSAQKSRYETSMTLREQMHGIFASPSSDNVEEINIGLISLLYNCQDDRSNFYLGRERLPVETTYFALHAPERINSRKLYMQMIDDVPILTASDHVYSFVRDSESKILSYYNIFEGPKELVDFGDLDEIPPEDSPYRHTIIFYYPDFDPDTDAIEYNSLQSSFNIVVISPSESGNSKYLYFWSSNVRIFEEVPFLSDAEVIGGIVDSDKYLFECIHEKQMQKELFNLKLLDSKIDVYLSHENISEDCKNIIDFVSFIVNDAIQDFEESNTEEQLAEKKRSISNYNLDLARNNCPLIE